jgi:hypothetical protein
MGASTALKLRTEGEVLQELGTVTEVAGDTYALEARRGRYSARRAVSCLVEPELDDEVLFAGRQEGPLYILAVLERPGRDAAVLRARGDLTVHVADGRFVVAAERGVDLITGKELSMTSGSLQVRAAEGHVTLETLSYLGTKLFGQVEQVKTFVGVLDSVLERLTQRVQRSYRFVEEFDVLRTKQADYVAKETLRIRGKNTLVNGDQLVKLEADQIHLG